MAEKATLLQKLPPVAKKPPEEAKASSDIAAKAGTESQVESDSGVSITSFQVVTYGSFALSFILAGFAAVILYRKSLSGIESRFATCAKVLAGTLAAMALHGFVAAYGYTNYLREVSDSTPLSLTVLIWIIIGVALGFVSNRIIELNGKPRTTDAIIDGILFAAVFICVTLAVSDQISTNTALILSLVAAITYVAPFSRFFIACKKVKLNRRQTQRKPIRPLLNSLISLPGILPILAILYVTQACGPDATLFVVNLVSIAFVLLVSFSMLVGISALSEKVESETTETAAVETASTAPTKPATPEMDPFLAELLAEQELPEEEAPLVAPATETPKIAPPQKPTRPDLGGSQASNETNVSQVESKLPKAPQKPGSKKAVPDNGLKVKAPSKPGKRL